MYWGDYYLNLIKSAKLDGSDSQLITNELSSPWGIDIDDNDIYFTEQRRRLYKQSKSPGSSKIQIHSDTSILDAKVYKGTGTYNVIKVVISTFVS